MILPLISFVTITFNCSKTLQATIDSIKKQNYSRIEYIIIDGGSTDKTIDIINYNSSFISKWISEPDKGVSDAFNKGIRMANGELIWLINADDVLLPNAVNSLLKYYNPNTEIYRGKMIIHDQSTGTNVVYEPAMNISFVSCGNVNHPSTIISKKAYKKYGLYDIKCRYMMDYDILLRMKLAGASFRYIPKQLACFNTGGITSENRKKRKQSELIYVLKKNGANKVDITKALFFRETKWYLKRILGNSFSLRIRDKLGKIGN